jgi:hypothetical protein
MDWSESLTLTGYCDCDCEECDLTAGTAEVEPESVETLQEKLRSVGFEIREIQRPPVPWDGGPFVRKLVADGAKENP